MRLLSLRPGVTPQNPFPSNSSTLSIIYLLPNEYFKAAGLPIGGGLVESACKRQEKRSSKR